MTGTICESWIVIPPVRLDWERAAAAVMPGGRGFGPMERT
jgi:hypothetical protein